MARVDSFTFTVPKQTSQTSPFQRRFDLWLPVIESINVQIPPGHKNAAEMEIVTPGYILMTGIHGDGQAKNSGRLLVKMFGPPWYINCIGWNSSVFLDHEFVVEVYTTDEE